jgi:HSP20 family molecular chaperone IbpA
MENLTSMSDVHEPMDIYEDSEGLHIELAVVGSKKEDVNIEIKDGYILTISKECNTEKSKDREYIISRLRRGNFNVSLQIANKFDLGSTKSIMKNGLLSINIPIKPGSQPRKLEIED